MEKIFESGFKEFARLRRQENTQPDAIIEGAQRAMRIAMNKEIDIIETNLVNLGLRRIQENVVISGQTRSIITDFHLIVGKALEDSVKAIRGGNEEAAEQVVAMKDEITWMAKQTAQHGLKRLIADEPNRLRTYTREMEIYENFQRIYTLCRSLARASITDRSEPDQLT